MGVTEEDIQILKDTTDKIRRLDILYPTVAKLAEKMKETRAKAVDQRERRIGTVVKTVRSRSKLKEYKGSGAKYEKADKYYSATADKGVRTKKKKGALKEVS